MGYRQDYVYADGTSSAQSQWRRVRIDQIPEKIMAPAHNYKCFASVQRYQKPHSEPKEKFWMPMFFDFDDKADPANCIPDVKRAVNFFLEILQIPTQYIRIYFSGSKGFHVIIEPEVFDIRPAEDLHLRIKKATMYLADVLELKTYDPVVYSVRRVLRLPNSIHESTKLFKIELTLAEVAMGMEWIKGTAKNPRKAVHDEEPQDVPMIEDAKLFWEKMMAEFDDVKELVHLKPSHTITDFGDLPVCMKHLLDLTSLPRANTGNRTLLSMATYLKDAGKTEHEAMLVLVPWFTKLVNVGGAGDAKMLTAAASSTIKYVYHRGMDDQQKPDAGYTFSCKYILGLSTGDHKIPCQGVQCPAIKGKMQETKDIIELELREFSRSSYLGEKVRIPALLSGKTGTPYVVPKRVRFTCAAGDKDNPFCDRCPVAKFNGDASFTLDARDPQVLELVACTNKDQMSAIKRKFRFPQDCHAQHLKVEEYMNIEEVRLSPAAADIKNFDSNEYVVRKGFFIGYPIEANKRYRLVGFPVKEPKSQASAFLFEEREKLATDIESFKVTPAVIEELKVFQPSEQQNIEMKWTEIHQDLAANVYRLIGREQMAFAVDLVTHSTRGFAFRTEPFVKGWAEMVVVGDSGCGKSKLVNALVHGHYGVGEMLDGASSKRTGLLYSFQENGGKGWMLIWGAFPLNDGGLITVDEFGDLPPEQFALMTEARSSGRVKATGVVNAETFARVRFIALTNPKKGRHLAEYDFPCTALKELVPAAADIRRFDLACAVSSSEVPYDKINSSEFEKVPHTYTKYLCSTLIKWAWSRDPSQVVFDDEASRMVLTFANQMAKDYYAGEIPLVEPADQRFKLARLSAACAARMFSTDETGERIIVRKEHVEFVYEVLMTIYMNQNFRYYDWSRDRRKSDLGGDSDMEALYTKFQQLQSWRRILGFLSLPGQIESKELDSLLGDRMKSQNCINVLRILGLVEKKWGKYQKTARGFQFPQWCLSHQKVTQAELDQAMMGDSGPIFEGGSQ